VTGDDGCEVDKKYIEENAIYQIEINSQLYTAVASLQPAYDPKGDKIKM